MLRAFLARRLELAANRVRPAIHLLLLAAVIQFALVLSVVAAQSLFLTRVGAERLAVFFLLLALASLPVAAAASALLARSSNLSLLTRGVLLVALASLGLNLLAAAAPETAAYVSMLVYAIATMQLLALFSALATDYLTSLELKRFVVLQTMASALGGLAGGVSLRWLSRTLTTQEIFLGLVAVYALIGVLLLRLKFLGGALEAGGPILFSRPAPGTLSRLVSGKPSPEGPFGGWANLRMLARRYPMTSLLAASGLLMTVVTGIFQVQVFAIFAREFPAEGELTAFLGMLNAGLKVLELFVAYTLTRPLIRRLGVGLANLFYPLTSLAAFLVLALSQTLGAALVAAFNYRTLANSLAGPVFNLDFNAVPQRWIGRLRVFLSGVVTPSGLVLSGLLLLFAQSRISPAAVSGVGAVLAAVLLALGVTIGRAYFRSLLAMLRARTVNLEEVAEGLVRLPASEAEPIREMLSSEDPQQQRVGLGLIERMDGSLFVSELEALVEHADRPTARALVTYYGRVGADFFTRRGPLLLESANEGVRAEALKRLLTTGPREYLEDTGRRLGRALIQDPSPEVRTVALAASYQLARSTASLAIPVAAGAAARRKLMEIFDQDGRSPRMLLIDGVLTSAPPAVRARVLEVLGNLAARGDGSLVELAQAQGDHADVRVRRAAIGLLAKACGDDRLDALARGLGDVEREVRDAATAALASRAAAGAEQAAIEAVRPYLTSVRPETIDAAVAAIGATGAPAAEQVLVAHLQQELERADEVRAWLREIPAGEPFWEPLRVAATDAAERIRRRVFQALAALGEEGTVRRVRQLLRSPDPRLRANAVETFASIRHRRLARPLAALLEAGLAPAGGSGPSDAASAVLERAVHDRDPWLRRAAAYMAAREGITLPEPESPPLEMAPVWLKLKPWSRASPLPGTESEVPMNRLLFLAQVPIFQRFTLDELSVVDVALEPVELFAGETVFTEGEPGDRFFILEQGKALFFKRSGDEELEVGRAGPGEYFGEMSLFDDSPRSATVTVPEDSLLLALDRDRLHSLVDQKPEIAWAFCRELSTRLRESNERWRSLNVRLRQSGGIKLA